MMTVNNYPNIAERTNIEAQISGLREDKRALEAKLSDQKFARGVSYFLGGLAAASLISAVGLVARGSEAAVGYILQILGSYAGTMGLLGLTNANEKIPQLANEIKNIDTQIAEFESYESE